MVKKARKLGALSVRGNHDDSALAAYEEFTRGHEVMLTCTHITSALLR